jgi:hypothetical protein
MIVGGKYVKGGKVPKRNSGVKVAKISIGRYKHILNEHKPSRIAQQLENMNKKQAERLLNNKTFFNKNWSETTIKNAAKTGYQKALKAKKRTGDYKFKYKGETITVHLDQGVLKTCYGHHNYTYEQLRKMR